MPRDAFLGLSADDRRQALGVAAAASGRPAYLLEKDVWVVWALNALFSTSFGESLVFKGGTSLSKAYKVIHRFSEDVDLTYDIRALLPGIPSDARPKTRSQARKWTDKARERLPIWVSEAVMPTLAERLAAEGLSASLRQLGGDVYIDYESQTDAPEYMKSWVKLEFGARSTGAPSQAQAVTCDAAEYLQQVEFPTARPRVMKAERTFWEKATAIHVFCSNGRLSAERYARHWHDIVRLDDAGIASSALADPALAKSVAEHKDMFFPEKDAEGSPVDYLSAVTGAIRLVPDGESMARLGNDYVAMVDAGLLLDDAPSFEQLMSRCAALESRLNAL